MSQHPVKSSFVPFCKDFLSSLWVSAVFVFTVVSGEAGWRWQMSSVRIRDVSPRHGLFDCFAPSWQLVEGSETCREKDTQMRPASCVMTLYVWVTDVGWLRGQAVSGTLLIDCGLAGELVHCLKRVPLGCFCYLDRWLMVCNTSMWTKGHWRRHVITLFRFSWMKIYENLYTVMLYQAGGPCDCMRALVQLINLSLV